MSDTGRLSLGLRIPSDDRLRDTVRALSAEMSSYSGAAPEEAQEIAAAVDRVVAGVIQVCNRQSDEPIDVRFLATKRQMEVLVESDPAPSSSPSLEQELGRRLNGALDLAALRRILDRIEFGFHDSHHYCRLIRDRAHAQ